MRNKVVTKKEFDWSSFFIIFLLIFTPLISGTVYYWSLTFTQFLVVFWLFLWWQKGDSIHLTKAEKCLLGFFLLAIFSFTVTPSRYHYLDEGFKMLCGVIIFFLVAHSSLGEDARRKFAWTIFFIGVLVSLYGLYQRGWGFAETFKYLENQRLTSKELGDMKGRLTSGRVFSTFVLPSSLAGYLGMVIPIAGLLVWQTSSWKRWLTLAGLLIILLCFFFTYSLGAWLIFFLFLLGGLLVVFFIGKSRKRWLFLLIILLIFILIGGGLLSKRGLPLARNFAGGAVRLRILNWMSTLKIIRDYPLLGKGLGSFALIYPRYKFVSANEVRYAHNWYLQLAAETGILGLALFIGFLGFIILPIVRRVKEILTRGALKKSFSCWLEVAFFISLLFFLLHNLADFDAYLPEVAITGWIIAGLIVSPSYQRKKGRSQQAKNIVVILVILSLIVWAGLNYFSGYYFQRGETFYDTDIDYSISQLKLSRKFMPIQADCLAFLGSAYNRKALGNEKENYLPKAISSYQQAISLEPTVASFHYMLGWLYWREGNSFASLLEFGKAVDNYPTLGKYHTSIAQAYEALGDRDQALQEYTQALVLDPHDTLASYKNSELKKARR